MYLGEVEIGYEEVAAFLQVSSHQDNQKNLIKITRKSELPENLLKITGKSPQDNQKISSG